MENYMDEMNLLQEDRNYDSLMQMCIMTTVNWKPQIHQQHSANRESLAL